jgi:hypothetical protein
MPSKRTIGALIINGNCAFRLNALLQSGKSESGLSGSRGYKSGFEVEISFRIIAGGSIDSDGL